MASDEVVRLEPAKASRPRKAAGGDAGVRQIDTTVEAATRSADLNATQSVIGSATVEGATSVDTSIVGMVSAKGAADLKQGFAGAVVADGDVAVSQGGSAVMVAKSIAVDHGGGGVLISGETTANRSYVGLLMARKASFSEDSRVLFDWKAALILAAVVLGGVGILIVVAIVLARVVMGRVHRVAERLPHLPEVHLPELPSWLVALARRMRAA